MLVGQPILAADSLSSESSRRKPAHSFRAPKQILILTANCSA